MALDSKTFSLISLAVPGHDGSPPTAAWWFFVVLSMLLNSWLTYDLSKQSDFSTFNVRWQLGHNFLHLLNFSIMWLLKAIVVAW
jgi:hypothetical protein